MSSRRPFAHRHLVIDTFEASVDLLASGPLAWEALRHSGTVARRREAIAGLGR